MPRKQHGAGVKDPELYERLRGRVEGEAHQGQPAWGRVSEL
jgi:hypothetical protein